jgi:hypothetical protein
MFYSEMEGRGKLKRCRIIFILRRLEDEASRESRPEVKKHCDAAEICYLPPCSRAPLRIMNDAVSNHAQSLLDPCPIRERTGATTGP